MAGEVFEAGPLLLHSHGRDGTAHPGLLGHARHPDIETSVVPTAAALKG